MLFEIVVITLCVFLLIFLKTNMFSTNENFAANIIDTIEIQIDKLEAKIVDLAMMLDKINMIIKQSNHGIPSETFIHKKCLIEKILYHLHQISTLEEDNFGSDNISVSGDINHFETELKKILDHLGLQNMWFSDESYSSIASKMEDSDSFLQN